jgi:transposase
MMVVGRERTGGAEAVSRVGGRAISIYLCQEPIDFRDGINGLAMIVEARLKYDPPQPVLLHQQTKEAN